MFVQIGIAIQHQSTMAYLEASLEASSLKEAETLPLTDSMILLQMDMITPYINPIFLNLERIDPSLRCSISANSFTVFPW